MLGSLGNYGYMYMENGSPHVERPGIGELLPAIRGVMLCHSVNFSSP